MASPFQIKSRLTGAVVFTTELGAEFEDKADGVKLGAAVKIAVKARADLARAYLAGAYLARAVDAIDAGTPNGWCAVGWRRNGVLRVRVGCRDFSIAEGRAYWQGKPGRREVLAALDYIEAVAKLREWPEAEKANG